MKKIYYTACILAITANMTILAWGLIKQSETENYYDYEKARCFIVSGLTLASHDFEDSNRPDLINKKINFEGSIIDYQVNKVDALNAFIKVNVNYKKKYYFREFITGNKTTNSLIVQTAETPAVAQTQPSETPTPTPAPTPLVTVTQ